MKILILLMLLFSAGSTFVQKKATLNVGSGQTESDIITKKIIK